MGEALQDYILVTIMKKQMDCCKKNIYRNKKIENSNNNEGNEQVKNKKATTNNKTMQSQQHGKWTWYKWIVAKTHL